MDGLPAGWLSLNLFAEDRQGGQSIEEVSLETSLHDRPNNPHCVGLNASQIGTTNLATAQETIGAVMAHYNDVAARITQSLWVEPIYEIDTNSDETLWEPWVAGFTRAMALRPKAWEALLERADDETRETMIFIMALQDIYIGNSKFSDEEIAQ